MQKLGVLEGGCHSSLMWLDFLPFYLVPSLHHGHRWVGRQHSVVRSCQCCSTKEYVLWMGTGRHPESLAPDLVPPSLWAWTHSRMEIFKWENVLGSWLMDVALENVMLLPCPQSYLIFLGNIRILNNYAVQWDFLQWWEGSISVLLNRAVATSLTWLLSTWTVASVIEELKF